MSRSWHNTCSSLGNFKKIGFPGWPDRTSTRFPVLGRQFKKGACTSPLFLFSLRNRSSFSLFACPPTNFMYNKRRLWTVVSFDLAPSHGPQAKNGSQKGERPVGGPAARAWGWRET